MSESDSIDSPVFLVGMPRSGTTVIFEILAAREDLAWFSGHLQRFPGHPSVALVSRLADLSPRMRRSVSRSDQARPGLERLRVGPVEAYPVWQRCCGERFRYDYLLNSRAEPGERECMRAVVGRVMRYHGKSRFAAKITGPARIEFLQSIFPSARFIQVVRDGRAVAQSLMRVHFWKERDRMNTPAWQGGLTETDLADWEGAGRSPLALAAIQWRRVLLSGRDEAERIAPERYGEVHYERFVSDPKRVLAAIADFCGMPVSPAAEAFLESRFELRDMNFQWKDRFDADDVAMLNGLLGPTLTAFGYGVEEPGLTASAPILAAPYAVARGSGPE